jgi:hypothetical protein
MAALSTKSKAYQGKKMFKIRGTPKTKKAATPSDEFAGLRLANEETFKAVWDNPKDSVWNKY